MTVINLIDVGDHVKLEADDSFYRIHAEYHAYNPADLEYALESLARDLTKQIYENMALTLAQRLDALYGIRRACK